MGINIDVLKTKLKKRLPDDKDMLKHLDIVAAEAERLSSLTLKFTQYLKLPEKERNRIQTGGIR